MLEIRIEREQLFDEVWRVPLSKLASKYEMSDVGLLKVCRKLNVPVPGRGYWAKKRKPKRPELPLHQGSQPYIVRRISAEVRGENNKDVSDELKSAIIFEKAPENKILVSSRLSSPHALIVQAQQAIRPPEEGIESIPLKNQRKCLDIRVSYKQLPRALRIFDALIKAIEERGISIAVLRENCTVVCVDGEQIKISLEEEFKTRARRLSPDEHINMLTGGWVPDRYVKVSTGSLCFHMDVSDYIGRKNWCDGKEQRLENCLNDVFIGILKAAASIKQNRIEHQKRALERIQQENLEFERMMRLEDDKRQLEKLEKDSEEWCRAERIRNYIESVKKKYIEMNGEIEPGCSFDLWLEKSSAYVDQFDPLLRVIKDHANRR